MDPVAILITKENAKEFEIEIRYAIHSVKGYDPSYFGGYYLVISDNGPELMTANRFANTYVFAIDPTKLMPIRNR